MVVLLWVGWGVAAFTFIFLAVVIFFGANSLRSKDWDYKLRQHAEKVCADRGSEINPQSIENLVAQEKMFHATQPELDTSQTADFSFLQVLLERSDYAELEQEVQNLASARLDSTIIRLDAAIKDHSSLVAASRRWRATKTKEEFSVYFLSLRWFLPKYLKCARKRAERYVSTTTLIGVVLGLLYWGFRSLTGVSTNDDPVSWLNVVGLIITFSAVSGFVAAIGVQIYYMLTKRHGKISSWPLKSVVLVTAFIIFFTSFLIANSLGLIQIFVRWLSLKIGDFLDTPSIAKWAGPTFICIGLLFYAFKLIRTAMDSRLRAEDKVRSIFYAVACVFIALIVVFSYVDISAGATRVLVIFFQGSFVAAAFSLVMVVIVKTFRAQKYLVAHGRTAQQGKFHPWMVVLWVAIFACDSLLSLLILRHGPYPLTGYQKTLSDVANWIGFVLLISFIPLIIGANRYRKRAISKQNQLRIERNIPPE